MFTFYVLLSGCKFVKNQNAKYMKEKILGKLKQAYSQLGLGDAILTAQAESLANSGFVTDENIDAIVAAQKPFLEGLQKANDSRVTEAVKKAKEAAKAELDAATKKAEEAAKLAKEEAEKAQAEAVKKALEDAKKATETPDNEPAWFKTFVERTQAEQANKAKEYKGLKDAFEQMKKDYDGAKEEAKKKARKDFIVNKAKELGVPQYRIDEGFAFAEDADDATITNSLTTIANNIKTNSLPQDKRFLMGDDKPSNEEVKSIAKSLVR